MNGARAGSGRARGSRAAGISLAVVILVGTGGCAGWPMLGGSDEGIRVRGAEVRVDRFQGESLHGEILAAEGGEVWIRSPAGVMWEVPSTSVRRVRVARHDVGVGGWSLAAAGVTTSGMMVACAGFDEGGCAGDVILFALVWGIPAGLATLLVRRRRYVMLSEMDDLRPWARFPQGLPEEYRDRVTRLPGR